MQCVFAHACYGAVLDDCGQKLIRDRLDSLREWIEEGLFPNPDDIPLYGHNEELLALSFKEPPGLLLLQEFQREYAAGPEAGLHYTGDDDEHFGGSATEPELWIIGYGVMAFPRDVPASFKSKAQWHMWVTGG